MSLDLLVVAELEEFLMGGCGFVYDASAAALEFLQKKVPKSQYQLQSKKKYGRLFKFTV